jgi:hypothetical protein
LTEAAQSAAAAGVVLVFVFTATLVFAFVVELEFVGGLVQPDHTASITASGSAINNRFGVSVRGLSIIQSSLDFVI